MRLPCNHDKPQVQVSNFEELPLMGFVPEPRIDYFGAESSLRRKAQLDPNHTYFVLLREAQDWGGEVKCMFEFIDYLADKEHLPMIHIIANGGRVTIKEVYHSVQQERYIIVLEGSVRATEVIAAALHGVSDTDLVTLLKQHKIATQVHEVKETLSWLKEIAEYTRITRFDFWSGHHEELKEIILSRLRLS